MTNVTPVVKFLLAVNIGIFAVQLLFEIDFPEIFGLRNIFAEKFEPYQLLTHIFVHSNHGLSHIFGNMLALFVFGPMIETVLGSRRFAILYFVAGLGASVLYSAVQMIELQQLESAVLAYMSAPDPDQFVAFLNKYSPFLYEKNIEFVESFSKNPTNTAYVQESVSFVKDFYFRVSNSPVVGASGAIFGVLMMFALLFPNIELMLLFPPIPIKAKYMVTLYMAYEIYSIVNAAPDDNVAHFAHVGGAFFGFFFFKYWKKHKLY